jgi:3-hydroxyisobutyrate dehydrogenase-like beta-hydroxyacid dehydrogenase
VVTNPTPVQKVGVIGLGRMGSALAEALLSRKRQIIVWNRSPDKSRSLATKGVEVAAHPRDVAHQVDVVIVCLSDFRAVQGSLMLDDVGDSLRGKTLVDMTTLNTDELRLEQGWANRHDVAFLKGAILGYPDDVRTSQCTILYGGPKAAFVANLEILRAFGERAVHASENMNDAEWIGSAYYCFLFSLLVGFLHGAAICHRKGLSIDSFARDLVLPRFQPSPIRGMLEELARRSQSRQYDGDIQASLNAWNDGLGSLVHDLKSDQLHPGLLNTVKEILDRAVAEGHGESDLSAAFEVMIERS